MTLSELGATLRTEREQRGIPLEEVAQRLRISLHVLQSLEEGNADALPHKAYAKGFIRSYATFLGLTADEVEAGVASLTGAPPSVPQPIATLEEEGDAPKVPAGKMLACAVVLLLLAGGGYAVWQSGLLSSLPLEFGQLKIAQPLLSPTQKQNVVEQPADNKKTAVAQAPTARESQPKKADKTPVANDTAPVPMPGTQPEGKKAAPPTAQNQRQAAPSPASQPNLPTGTAPGAQASVQNNAQNNAQASGPLSHHKIIVTAVEDCWIQSNADKSNTRQFTLRKGDTFALTFANSLEVKLGNAAGVRIRYNGNELPQAGKPGETRTLVFPQADSR